MDRFDCRLLLSLLVKALDRLSVRGKWEGDN
jgi:hypothetical protein